MFFRRTIINLLKKNVGNDSDLNKFEYKISNAEKKIFFYDIQISQSTQRPLCKKKTKFNMSLEINRLNLRFVCVPF